MSIPDLAAVLSYDQETGVFTWVKTSKNGKAKKNTSAGRINDKGYVVIGFQAKRYLAHRVAWYMAFGKEPDGWIDHINGDRSDNRIENLRVVTPFENAHNIHAPYSTNSSGFLGCYFDPQKNRWRAEIIAKKRRHRLGWFKTADEAQAAYLEAKKVLHPCATLVKNVATEKTVEDFGDGTESLGGWRPKSKPTDLFGANI